jgi:hypothetical protein
MSESKQADLSRLEAAAAELIAAFDVSLPPVPVESMLQHPKAGMWDQVDITQLSGTFLSVRDQYSPRMSLARLLARHVVVSPWGTARNLQGMLKDDSLLRTFARMLVMPRSMVDTLSSGARNPTTMSMHFEVPEDDARQRLHELASYD